MNFEEAHSVWLQSHLSRRTGERKGRLERGHQHAEILFLQNVWWPIFGNFDRLHPEYEVMDWRSRSYFADFAWLTGYSKILIEIKGFNAHVRDMDRQRYCDELNRETFLKALGFRVISFAYDDVAKRPDICIHFIRMLINLFETSYSLETRLEKEVVRLVYQLGSPIRPIDISNYLKLNYRTSVQCLRKLCEKGWLRPLSSGRGQRIRKYELTQKSIEQIWGIL